MALPRIGGKNLPLNLNGAFAAQLPVGAQTATSASFSAGAANASNAVTLQPGGVFLLPAGTFYVEPGAVTSLQFLDPVTQIWRTVNSTPNAGGFNVDADGGNIRLANLTGCVIGAVITNVGTGMTNGIGATTTGLTITPSAGGSVWIPVVGGTNSTAITITTAGSNYSFPPLLVCSPPPAGGVQMTAVCSVAGGSIASVTATNVGAGYTAVPSITVINDFRDTTGSGAVLTPGPLTGSGTLTAMYPSAAANTSFTSLTGGHGSAVTSPVTFTFSAGTSCSAVSIMNFVVTGITVTGGGSGLGTSAALVAVPQAISTARAAGLGGAGLVGNGIQDTGLVFPRPAWIQPLLNSGSVSTTGNLIVDPGFGFQVAPIVTPMIATLATAPSTGINITSLVGGISDTSWIQPF